MKTKNSQWTAYRNTGKGAIYLGGSKTNYKDTNDKSNALVFGNKDLVLEYIKSFNEELKKKGESKWMPIEFQ